LISTKKIKNNLLASVLILTVVPSSIKVGRGVIEQCYFLISQKLLEIDEVSIPLSTFGPALISDNSRHPSLLPTAPELS